MQKLIQIGPVFQTSFSIICFDLKFWKRGRRGHGQARTSVDVNAVDTEADAKNLRTIRTVGAYESDLQISDL